jgi:hypothetical protein
MTVAEQSSSGKTQTDYNTISPALSYLHSIMLCPIPRREKIPMFLYQSKCSKSSELFWIPSSYLTGHEVARFGKPCEPRMVPAPTKERDHTYPVA